MENSSKLYQASMMSIVQLLEESPKLPDLLCIHSDLLCELRKLDAYGQKLISSKADKFLSINIDCDQLQKHMDILAVRIDQDHLEYETLLHRPPQPSKKPYSKLHQVLMMSIIHLLEECPELPDVLNIHNELLYRLRKLNAYGQNIIASKADEFLCVKIDDDELQHQINNLAEQVAERELEDEYIKCLAPCKLMRQLFGMHATEFSQRRKFLGLSKQGQHRPRYCNKDTEFAIWQHWKKTEGMDERKRYLLVAKKTDQPLNLIYAAVKSYYESAPKEESPYDKR